eukprot:824410-Rhodomonas_salina.4
MAVLSKIKPKLAMYHSEGSSFGAAWFGLGTPETKVRSATGRRAYASVSGGEYYMASATEGGQYLSFQRFKIAFVAIPGYRCAGSSIPLKGRFLGGLRGYLGGCFVQTENPADARLYKRVVLDNCNCHTRVAPSKICSYLLEFTMVSGRCTEYHDTVWRAQKQRQTP